MNFKIEEIATVTMILFAVIDILGCISIIIDLRKKTGQIDSEKISLVAMAIMLIFLFTGDIILKILGLDITSFALAGALVIFFMALEMLLGISLYKENSFKSISIVPLAFPLIAGAGTISTIISMKAEFELISIIVGIMLNIVIIYLVLKNSFRLEKILGDTGLAILRKVFGLVLLAISIKIFRGHTGF